MTQMSKIMAKLNVKININKTNKTSQNKCNEKMYKITVSYPEQIFSISANAAFLASRPDSAALSSRDFEGVRDITQTTSIVIFLSVWRITAQFVYSQSDNNTCKHHIQYSN